MKKSLLYLLLLVVSTTIAIPAMSFTDDWVDEGLFFGLEEDEVVFGPVPNRENAMKVHGKYLFMIRDITRDGVTKEALLKYNLETQVIYEFRYELLPPFIRFDIGANKLFVPILLGPSYPGHQSNILVYDLEKDRWKTISTNHSKIAHTLKVLSDNALFTLHPPLSCCSYTLTRRDVETLEIITSNHINSEYFWPKPRLSEYNGNLYFLRTQYNPGGIGSRDRISFFSSNNSVVNLAMSYFAPNLYDLALTDEYIIVGGSSVEIFDFQYVDYYQFLGKLVAFNKDDTNEYFAIVPDVSGTINSLEVVGNHLYFTGSITDLGEGTSIGGIASYNLGTGQYNTFNGGVDGVVNASLITDEWFIIGGDFVSHNEDEPLENIAYWDAANEKWKPFEVKGYEGEDPSNDDPEIPEVIYLNQNYPNPFNPVTQINYGLTESSFVNLEVFNMKGQRILILDRGFREPGSYNLTFDGTGLASGIYVYRLTTNSQTQVRKMTLVK